jgi:spore germination cell wall hydrolase CwlJ-like protein
MRVRVLIAALVAVCSAAAWPIKAEPATDAVRVMALNMYHEARGEGRKGMIAVGWVVLNRMADPAYPGTVREVVYQGCQFSWVCDGRSDRPRDRRAWRKAVQLATALLRKPVIDPTRGALWYHATRIKRPNLGSPVRTAARIGRHVFYARAARQGGQLTVASR